jgi:hypothetical protein
MQYVRTVKEPMPFEEMGWGVIGRKLADAMQGSDMEVYYSLLCATVRRCQEDMERIKPTSGMVVADVESININPLPPLVEKIADLTHRGSGL